MVEQQIKRRKYLLAHDIDGGLVDYDYPLSLCFSGCGFLISYYIGVISCFRERAPHFISNIHRIYGSSGGALAGVTIIAGFSTERMLKATSGLLFYVTSKKFGLIDPFLKLETYLRGVLRDELPEDIHRLCTNRLFINLTHFRSFKPKLVSEYHTKEDLIDAIICSCYVPCIFGFFPPKFRGQAKSYEQYT
ncbi:Patatin-like phospholipase domain-containing protein 3 [Thelohanellus kitauei]|uniref:Patatin-like phospholipase domain-containing protein 3 n=1 Tax=Thelohanellus kitauei TaxID=669202 RepID=A0A0C2JBU1_THEKT|nr:Patatin-like phospholipase domain-containing protein 3 [Thelohanellus kitauei]